MYCVWYITEIHTTVTISHRLYSEWKTDNVSILHRLELDERVVQYNQKIFEVCLLLWYCRCMYTSVEAHKVGGTYMYTLCMVLHILWNCDTHITCVGHTHVTVLVADLCSFICSCWFNRSMIILCLMVCVVSCCTCSASFLPVLVDCLQTGCEEVCQQV